MSKRYVVHQPKQHRCCQHGRHRVRMGHQPALDCAAEQQLLANPRQQGQQDQHGRGVAGGKVIQALHLAFEVFREQAWHACQQEQHAIGARCADGTVKQARPEPRTNEQHRNPEYQNSQ